MQIWFLAGLLLKGHCGTIPDHVNMCLNAQIANQLQREGDM